MRRLPWLLPLLLPACATDPDPVGPTYHQDVRPVLETYCTRCHNPEGSGAGDWTDPAAVTQLGEALLGAVEAGRMPPPVADPACRDYDGSEFLAIDEDSKATLRAWVEAGKPLGDPATSVTVDPPDFTLPEANTVFQMTQAYTPDFDDPTFPGNEYRCFVLTNDATEPFFITGMAPLVDATEIVHHIVVSRIDKDRNLPAHDRAQGFECANFNILDGMLAGWAPGTLPIRAPEGGGLRVGPDEDIIMQIHYYDARPGEVIADRSGYAFATTDAVDRTLLMLPLGSDGWTIPAGEEAFTDRTSFRLSQIGIPVDVEVYGTFPHMHVLGAGWKLWAETDDGEQCISSSDRYDFHNQMTYMFREPLRLKSTDRLGFECTWNNSVSNDDRIFDVPRDTRWGEGTDSEMCFFFTYGAVAQ